MAEYIDREALLKAISKVGGSPLSEWDTAGVVDLVTNQPAADVAPVVHGRWVDRIVDENEVIQPWMNRYYCSECLEGVSQSWFKFCPNCGAKMEITNDN